MITPDGRSVEPLEETLPAGSVLYRVHQAQFAAADFNPGSAGQAGTRFAFFGDPRIPVLYAADHEMAAISETLLHDVPVAGGSISATVVESRVLSGLVLERDLKVLALHGDGFRRVGIPAEEITRTPASAYPQTVLWAEAAHRAGFDGMVWMSRHFDTARSYVFFGGADQPAAFTVHPDPDVARPFAFGTHLDWLTVHLAPLNVLITHP